MHEILPRLYLGNLRDAENGEALFQHHVTRLLNASDAANDHITQAHGSSFAVEFLRVDIRDETSASLIESFEACCQFIDTVVSDESSREAVLVHCNLGCSRSAVIVLAYLVRCRKMTLNQAYYHTVARKDDIEPEICFWWQLELLELRLKREHDLFPSADVAATGDAYAHTTKRAKITSSETGDDVGICAATCSLSVRDYIAVRMRMEEYYGEDGICSAALSLVLNELLPEPAEQPSCTQAWPEFWEVIGAYETHIERDIPVQPLQPSDSGRCTSEPGKITGDLPCIVVGAWYKVDGRTVVVSRVEEVAITFHYISDGDVDKRDHAEVKSVKGRRWFLAHVTPASLGEHRPRCVAHKQINHCEVSVARSLGLPAAADLEYQRLRMALRNTEIVEPLTPPTGFGVRHFGQGLGARDWARVCAEAGELANEPEPEAALLQCFEREFARWACALPRRMFFIVDGEGRAVATATAWFDETNSKSGGGGVDGTSRGRVHWVSVVPRAQGQGLAKVLMSLVLSCLADLHRECKDSAYLTTQTSSARAIAMYLEIGFAPEAEDHGIFSSNEQAGWAAVNRCFEGKLVAHCESGSGSACQKCVLCDVSTKQLC
jgi:protein-tyrosine phosphatase/GNAT superfamily N-acetyltransferase